MITARTTTATSPLRVRRLATWLVAGMVVVVWFTVLRPMALGGSTGYIAVTGDSMVPALNDGDLTIVRRQDSYEVGDVVAFVVPDADAGEPPKVVHRIIGLTDTGFVTKGDGNAGPDTWHPREADVVGAVRLHVPLIGRFLAASSARLFFALLGLLGVGLFARGVRRDRRAGASVDVDDDGVVIDLRDEVLAPMAARADDGEQQPARR